MNREIKFRVWDNVDYMSTPFTLQDIQSGKIQFTGDVKIMQFTGLLDKNGKEIWEGDILKVDDQEDKSKCTVVFINGAFQRRGTRLKYHSHFEPIDFDLWLVAGNIHETPELLK